MHYETITVRNHQGVLIITLNRPERLNAWTYQMGRELHHAIGAGNEQDDVIAMILTGAGRGFCAGADIIDLFQAQADGEPSASNDEHRPGSWVDLVRASKPMIAAVNGAAVGVGLTQILPFDYIIAAPEAKFSARFIKMGLVPELASSFYIAARTGFGQANRLMLTGETILAERALAIGLIDETVEDLGALMPRAEDLAQAMGNNPQQALRMVKTLITENIAESDLTQVQAKEMKALQICYESPEHKEAIDAFIHKREPDFKRARMDDGGTP
ncbi:MAG: enoyl-CoA hydratase/isomerase family protein [Pseudomonadales bacterium]